MSPSNRVKSSQTLKSITQFFEERAPGAAAEKWDNVGLLVGAGNPKIKTAIVSIDLTEKSIELAKRKGANLIVNHHPCIFPKGKGLSRLTDHGSSKLVMAAAQSGIAVFATHTNFDRCALEVPEQISKALGVKPVGRLFDGEGAEFLKLSVFVPERFLEKVRTAICEAGAGKIGNYDQCTFSVEGTGTFRGGSMTNPFIGKPGKLERAHEARLETVFPRGMKSKIMRAMKAAHPYEEIAYDLYPVEQTPSGMGLVSGLGYGVVAEWSRPTQVAEVLKRVKRAFRTQSFWLTNGAPKKIERIGFVAGKGSGFVKSAIQVGCDLFVTGEAGYHVAREASQAGIAVLELGHTQSEYFFLKTAEKWLKENGIKTHLESSQIQSIY